MKGSFSLRRHEIWAAAQTAAKCLVFWPLAILSLVGGGPASTATSELAFEAESITLENGLRLVILEDHGAPIVTQILVYQVGSADEEPGKSGLAHFLEHLLFKGTKEVPGDMFTRLIAQQGGQQNAYTNYDVTVYYQTAAAQSLELLMRLEADRMRNLQLSAETVLPERDVVLEEKRMRIDNVPGARLGAAMRSALFRHHPYRRPIIGWGHEVAALDLGAALEFYDRWYAPNNAILIIAGDVEPEAVKDLTRRHYGSIATRPVPPRDWVQEPEFLAAQQVELADPQVTQPVLRRIYATPSLTFPDVNEAYALLVLGEILGGDAGRLYQQLVLRDQVATSANCGADVNAREWGIFSCTIQPSGTRSLEDMEQRLNQAIEDIATEGVSDAEWRDAITRMQAEAIKARDGIQGLAQAVASGLGSGLTLEEIQAWPIRIGAVSRDAIQSAARNLDPLKSVTGYLLPEKGRAGIGSLETPAPSLELQAP